LFDVAAEVFAVKVAPTSVELMILVPVKITAECKVIGNGNVYMGT